MATQSRQKVSGRKARKVTFRHLHAHTRMIAVINTYDDADADADDGDDRWYSIWGRRYNGLHAGCAGAEGGLGTIAGGR